MKWVRRELAYELNEESPVIPLDGEPASVISRIQICTISQTASDLSGFL